MPRIRTVKPEFWDDEKLARMSIPSNLLYIGMWNYADDEGIIRRSANWIKCTVFPHREELRLVEVKGWIEELEKSRMIIPFEHNGEGYYVIRNFKRHQRIDKPQPSKIPKEVIRGVLHEFPDDSKNIPRTLPPVMEGKGMEWKRNGEGDARARDEILIFFLKEFKEYWPHDAARLDREKEQIVAWKEELKRECKNDEQREKLRMSFLAKLETLTKKKEKIINHAITKFWDHYQARGWKAKGDVVIVDKFAAFRSWLGKEAFHVKQFD